MNFFRKYFFLIFVANILACSSNPHLVNYLDFNAPLVLKDLNSGIQNGSVLYDSILILPHTEKFNRFINWCKKNGKGWEWSPATYQPGMTISQRRFQLSYFDYGEVVVEFFENDKQAKQYHKSIGKGELDFLREVD